MEMLRVILKHAVSKIKARFFLGLILERCVHFIKKSVFFFQDASKNTMWLKNNTKNVMERMFIRETKVQCTFCLYEYNYFHFHLKIQT